MDRIQELRVYYGALNGLLDTLVSSAEPSVSNRISNDYKHIYSQISDIVEVDLTYLSPEKLRHSNYSYGDDSSDMRVDKIEIVSKCKQLRGILESGYNVTDKIVQIGSLYNAILDDELRSRCADLLTANGHFDRVINQATQILEDRVRKKSKLSDSGKSLISKAINSDFSKSVLVLSNNSNEQEGYASIMRGLMQTIRNSAHHDLSDTVTRNDAFAVCGFIDQLLRVVDQSEINS